jgi:hypothetical protein
MINTESKSVGRPKSKTKLKNFRFRKDVDNFIIQESDRLGISMTQFIERVVLSAKALKTAERNKLVLGVV